jgi:hypothetical protein
LSPHASIVIAPACFAPLSIPRQSQIYIGALATSHLAAGTFCLFGVRSLSTTASSQSTTLSTTDASSWCWRVGGTSHSVVVSGLDTHQYFAGTGTELSATSRWLLFFQIRFVRIGPPTLLFCG